jgi:hypothetical protein
MLHLLSFITFFNLIFNVAVIKEKKRWEKTLPLDVVSDPGGGGTSTGGVEGVGADVFDDW